MENQHSKIQIPEYSSFVKITKQPDPNCKGKWQKSETDDMIYWNCPDCKASAVAEVID